MPTPPSAPLSAPALVIAGRAWIGDRLQPVEVAIDDDGRIASVGRSRPGPRRHDVGERVILPAATDLHVHLREPGGAGETIAAGTIEAALGGVTVVGEMPNTQPAVTDVERLEAKEARVRGRAAVDVLLYASVEPARPQFGALAARAGGFKLFLSPTTGVERVPSPEELAPLLRELGRYDVALSVHAEAPRDFSELRPPGDPRGWNVARPIAAELTALDELAPAPASLRLNVAHVTTGAGVERLRRQGRAFEATPHHLLLSERSGDDARFKVNPPLRPETERQALWAAFARGDVPFLASDHAPHPAESKGDRFDRAPSGMPGLETMLPLLLARVRDGELSLDVLQRAACDRPARWLGQPLGRLAPGHRANLIVVDFRRRRRIRASELHAPCGWSAFDGREAVFPVEHWRDGRPVVRDGEYVGTPNGSVVRPEYAPGARPNGGPGLRGPGG